MLCTCPAGAALPTIPTFDCFESFGQVQKVAFQRIYSAAGVKNTFDSTADSILLKASWTAKTAASNGLKVAVSPWIEAPTAEAGAAREFGGGNETLGGIVEIVGSEATPFTGVIRRAPQNVIKELKKLSCERIGVYLFDENGHIGAIRKGTTPTFTYEPIPIRAFFVGDKTLGGYDNFDSNVIRWSFLPNWSDDLVKVAPTDFNPLTDL